ncbi:unnamed protein product, partial [Ixodes hexagonus]
DALNPKPVCKQRWTEEATRWVNSEDCLHLNIWTPVGNQTAHDLVQCACKTVIVFIHGGFFQEGGNLIGSFRRQYLSAYGDVVVVIPNYRLGVMGFLYDGTEEAPGNVGLQDQLLALEWVRWNIASFGGNKSSVVVMGHDAGAASIGYHL